MESKSANLFAKETAMNILFAINLIGATSGGGLFLQAKNTAKYLTERGVSITFHQPWERIDFKTIDAVHIFGAGLGTYHFARELFARKIPVFLSPVFFSTHSAYQLQHGIHLQNIFRKVISGTFTDFGMTAEMCKRATAIFPNSNAEAQLLKEAFGIDEKKISIIPNGVDERFYFATSDEFVKTYGQENFVLNVGYWGERKNTLRLICALKKLDIPSVLIGRISGDEYAKECIKKIADARNITVREEIRNDSSLLASAYSAASVFVLPSLFETPGISALEAGLAGTNVAITSVGGTKEYFQSFAEYLEPTSETSIETAILKSFSLQKNNTLREHLRKYFLWNVVAEKTEAAYVLYLQ
ncbi:MAG: glycosyltransferase family 4 protein [Ignavibacteria bacterium]|nr:glycosyltransferase family 4 protein [Ignavibacteria bacterium]